MSTTDLTTTTPLPTSPTALADRILTIGDTDLTTALTAQIGWQAARHTLADAYTIAATRLRQHGGT